MDAWQTVVALTLMAGMAMPLGGWIALEERIGPRWLETELRHGIIAFGGGALLSAVALVLVPNGVDDLTVGTALAWFLAGGLAFMGLDILLNISGASASQLAAMLSDFLPEALALGAAFAYGGSGGILLALLMALQNLPEGFNAYRELRDSTHYSTRRLLGLFFTMAWLGPLAGLSGFLWLAPFPSAVGAIMLFAAGGILYSVFQDLAPQAKLERHWGPPLGAVLGFGLGVAGHMLLH
ncbi:ZIP family metal transporter [Halomonas nitroreducens]|uniref:Divalent cation transporter n=1 Tax=Halomonas nitroreducens TaxID=447425 RepID=A0A3S0KNG9_9GAMM|nr:divalent cation transporter [Halomonas nitroreducens]RTQ99137.1 divalent cation transporter [Halomonas nitroreducens]